MDFLRKLFGGDARKEEESYSMGLRSAMSEAELAKQQKERELQLAREASAKEAEEKRQIHAANIAHAADIYFRQYLQVLGLNAQVAKNPAKFDGIWLGCFARDRVETRDVSPTDMTKLETFFDVVITLAYYSACPSCKQMVPQYQLGGTTTSWDEFDKRYPELIEWEANGGAVSTYLIDRENVLSRLNEINKGTNQIANWQIKDSHICSGRSARRWGW